MRQAYINAYIAKGLHTSGALRHIAGEADARTSLGLSPSQISTYPSHEQLLPYHVPAGNFATRGIEVLCEGDSGAPSKARHIV